MTVMVGLLRGINVGGGSTKVSMAELRGALERRGFDRVRTYIQSGNVVLETDRSSIAQVEHELEAAVAEVSSVRAPAAVVVTRDELAAVLDANPFADRGSEPVVEGGPPPLHVTFSSSPNATPLGLDPSDFAPEDAVVVGRCTYLWLPGGMGRSKLAAALQRGATPEGTTRNWRTVSRLLAMADERP